MGSWETVRYEPEQFIEAGDHVVCDGAMRRLALYQDHDEALEATGLRPRRG